MTTEQAIQEIEKLKNEWANMAHGAEMIAGENKDNTMCQTLGFYAIILRRRIGELSVLQQKLNGTYVDIVWDIET